VETKKEHDFLLVSEKLVSFGRSLSEKLWLKCLKKMIRTLT